jgi:hypothetical protein
LRRPCESCRRTDDLVLYTRRVPPTIAAAWAAHCFAHLHDEPDPYGSPPPLQAGDWATTEWPLFHPLRQMFVRQGRLHLGAQVSSGSFLSGVKSIIFRRTEMYVPVSKWQHAMKTVNLNIANSAGRSAMPRDGEPGQFSGATKLNAARMGATARELKRK